MNTFAKAAIAAVVVIAIGAVGLSMLGPGNSSNVGAAPTASPSPAPSSSPSPSPVASAPPPLSSSFTSTMHGISLSYPAGWAVSGATQNWTGGAVNFPSPDIDYLYDRALTSDLFLAVASQPLGGKSGETWMTDLLGNPEADCYTAGTPVAVDGANGLQCGTQVAIAVADRGYFIRLYVSDDHPELDASYDSVWFRGLLETVQWHPQKALDRPGPASASPSS